ADVEQVINQLNHVRQLALDHLARPASDDVAGLTLEQLKGVEDRRQRIAQFVSKSGQEFTLAARIAVQRLTALLQFLAGQHLGGNVANIASYTIVSVRQKRPVDSPFIVLSGVTINSMYHALRSVIGFAGLQTMAKTLHQFIGILLRPQFVDDFIEAA